MKIFSIALKIIIFGIVFSQYNINTDCLAKEIIFASGEETGVYNQIGNGIVKIIEKRFPDKKVIVLNTKGSVENAKLIKTKTVHLALIQNDIAYYFCEGKRIFDFPSTEMKGVASLYTEAIHIITKEKSNIKNIKDLKNRKVAVGLLGSGTEFHARIILNSVALDYNDIEEQFMGLEDALDCFIKNEIDVVFFTGGIPVPAIEKIAEEQNIRFLGINTTVIKKLRDAYPYFISTTMPVSSYNNQYKEITTVGVRVLLVANRLVNSDFVFGTVDALFKEKEILQAAHRVGGTIILKDSLKGMTIPLHQGAERYYEKQRMPKANLTKPIFHILIGLLCAGILILIVKNYHFISTLLRKYTNIKMLLILLIIFACSGIGMFFFEHKVNENFSTLSESYWSIIVYVLSGFEDRPPITTGGRFMSVVVFIFSLSLFGIVTGKIASFFIINKLGGKKMPKNLKDHIVICNWNERGDKLVKELYKGAPEKQIIVITTSEIKEEKLIGGKEYENIIFIYGDPSLHSVLKNQMLHLAKSVVILADDRSSDPDAISVLISLAITKICEAEKMKKPHIVAEAINHKKVEHLKDAGVDEIICSVDYGLGILAQSALYEKLSDAYQQLLSYSSSTNELYVITGKEIPDEIIKNQMTFEEASEYFIENRDPQNPVILIGVRRNIKGENKIILNPILHWQGPEDEKFERFREGDALIFLSYEKPIFRKQIGQHME